MSFLSASGVPQQLRNNAVCIQVVTATISLSASVAMAIFTCRRENGGMKTPYRRIIFGLSVSDIFQSFAILSGPWSVPSWIDDSWGRGNDASCRANGFFLTLGQSSMPLYTCFICLYYICKLKYRMPDEDFKHKIEWKVHTFIVLYDVIVAGSALLLRLYNTALGRTLCYISATPLDCRKIPEIVGECDKPRAQLVSIYIYLNVYVLCGISLCAITVMMLILYKHAHFMENLSGTSIKQSESRANNEAELEDNQSVEGREVSPKLEQNNDIQKIYKRQVMIQATCYVGAFIITNLPPTIAILIIFFNNSTDSLSVRIVYCLGVFLYPLGGLFNILVYARPKVVVLQRKHPEYSWLKGLVLVLRAGGELPSEPEDSVFYSWVSLGIMRESDSVSRNMHQIESFEDEGNSRFISKGEPSFISESNLSYEDSDIAVEQIVSSLGDSSINISSYNVSIPGSEYDSSNLSYSIEKSFYSSDKM